MSEVRVARSICSIYLSLLPVSTADDASVVAHLTRIINEIYGKAETGMFCASHSRTNVLEVKALIHSQQLMVASSSAVTSSLPCDNIMGCIRVAMLSPTMGTLGLLCTIPRARHEGVGKRLVSAAESHCCNLGATSMRLELLVPLNYELPLKVWIQAWYERLGYTVIRDEDIMLNFARLAPNLVTPVVFRIFEKQLI